MKNRTIISIDPDVSKSGFVILNVNSKKIQFYTLKFPELLESLKEAAATYSDLKVLVEAGWLNKSHHHLSSKDSKYSAAKKGNDVGRNHETGRKIVEMAVHYGLSVEEIRPLPKIWKAKDGKISHVEIAKFIKNIPNRTNQENRDAALIAWAYANFPIKK